MSTARHPEFAAVALGSLSAIYNAAYRMTGNEHDAEDLAQEAYVDAFGHAAQLRDLADCRPWLFRSSANRFISSERKRRAWPEGDDSPWWLPRSAGICLLGLAYGFLQGAWPFGLIEAVWSALALRRWRLLPRRVGPRPDGS